MINDNIKHSWIIEEEKQQEFSPIVELNHFKQKIEPNYVIIDGSVWEEDLENALLLNPTYRSLYRGAAAEEMWSVAPYLFTVEPNSEFEKWVKKKSKEKRVLWLTSGSNIDDLRRHLRRFLRVKSEAGDFLYFRFYDPYVQNYVMPSLTQTQVKEFFSCINCVISEDIRIDERRFWSLSKNNKLLIYYENINNVDNN